MYLTKFSVQGKTDSAYSADNVCANYSIDGRVTPGNSSCTVSTYNIEQFLSLFLKIRLFDVKHRTTATSDCKIFF